MRAFKSAIGFGFASRWLKNRHEILEPGGKRSKLYHVTSFDSHLKTTLMRNKNKHNIIKREFFLLNLL